MAKALHQIYNINLISSLALVSHLEVRSHSIRTFKSANCPGMFRVHPPVCCVMPFCVFHSAKAIDSPADAGIANRVVRNFEFTR